MAVHPGANAFSGEDPLIVDTILISQEQTADVKVGTADQLCPVVDVEIDENTRALLPEFQNILLEE